MESDEDLGTKTELAIDVGWMADGDVELESKPLGGGKRGRRRGTLSSANSKYSAERLAKETPEKRAVRLARMRDYAKRRREESKDLKEKSLAHGSAEHYVSRSGEFVLSCPAWLHSLLYIQLMNMVASFLRKRRKKKRSAQIRLDLD